MQGGKIVTTLGLSWLRVAECSDLPVILWPLMHRAVDSDKATVSGERTQAAAETTKQAREHCDPDGQWGHRAIGETVKGELRELRSSMRIPFYRPGVTRG